MTVKNVTANDARSELHGGAEWSSLRSLCCQSNFWSVCIELAPMRVLRAASRDKCAFRGGNVLQCAVMCALFSRKASNSKNLSCHQKSLWTHFLALFLRGLYRVISTHLGLYRVISTDFIYTRARAFARSSFGLGHSLDITGLVIRHLKIPLPPSERAIALDST